MASEDVIELGSSDEDPEPAPKKSKPMPNAMVCIPSKLHEVTIKPAKINKTIPPKGIVRGVSIKTTVTIKNAQNQKVVKPQQLNINPLSIRKVVKNPNQSSQSNVLPKTYGPAKVLKDPVKIFNSATLTKLPPSITVRKTSQLTKRPILILNPPQGQKVLAAKKKAIKLVQSVPTVELDDDESPVNPSHKWYIRPEEENQSCSLEQQNNNEPTEPKMIEITIEDSPIKAVHDKRTCEVGAELAITIEDSPNKPDANKADSPSGSEDEKEVRRKESPRKKKLEYPKDGDDKKTMLIEIDMPLEETLNIVNKGNENVKSIQISNSDKKTPETSQKVETLEKTQNPIATTSKKDESEFHSVYQNFIDLCFKLEDSEDMTKIVEKKIKGYYRQVPKEYTESEEFIDMVSSKIMAMKASPDKMYLYIKDVVDELNMQRKIAKSQGNTISNEAKVEEPEQISFEEDCEYDTKRQRQIRKLEKTIKKLHRAIQKLEAQEVDFDDDDDSVYLLTERYKERMVRVYAKFCQLTNTKMPSEPRIQIDARPGQPTGPAKRLEKWINKKVPIGTPLPFPDFHDVIRCVRDANEEDKLCWNEADIMEEARDLFTRCGKKLQRRRQENEWRLAASRITSDVDPAEKDDQLKSKLSENKKLADKKETEIFNRFADRQKQLKLEGEEIGDKEAEESPVESEEDEAADDGVLLENKENRKDRLKRLLQERSKRISDEKENQPSKESEVSIAGDKDPQTNENDASVKEPAAEGKAKQHEPYASNSCDVSDKISLSDDSNDLESDIDELHLLQKLHSENEAGTSSQESSGFDSPIAISDSYESDNASDGNKELSDVYSIEDSSFSETEADNAASTKDIEIVEHPDEETKKLDEMETESSNIVIESVCSTSVEAFGESSRAIITESTECSKTGIVETRREINDEENKGPDENMLLASSDEENSQEESITLSGCVNVRDDLISIEDTVVGNDAEQPENDVEMAPVAERVSKDTTVPETETNVDIDDGNKDKEKAKESHDIENDRSQYNVLNNPMETTENRICIISDVTTSAAVLDMNITNGDSNETDNGSEKKSSEKENVPSTLSIET
ncbi:unnamed protein product [Chrysodeixis includens]|uniref:Daxx histone-binding domain-containing protein n=1 Tax=Chrysodeixis includens TaxID=689277 RepID=A0A9P0BXD7_CHRIL|nr:unnamed protein product [Chrysodeixis includens]